MNFFANAGLDLLYPKKCAACQEILTVQDGGVCAECRKSLPLIGENFCLKCGKFLEDEEKEFCEDCQEKEHMFVQNRGVYRYEKQMKGMIYRFKYQNQRYYAGFFGKEIAGRLGRQIRYWQVDGVIPVPLHKSRKRVRGFNQAEEISKGICERLELPLYSGVVKRDKKTLPQKFLNEKAREKNLKNAFKIADNSVKLKRVLLVDDIYTTGSTLDALAETLLENGVERVYAVCLCIGEGR